MLLKRRNHYSFANSMLFLGVLGRHGNMKKKTNLLSSRSNLLLNFLGMRTRFQSKIYIDNLKKKNTIVDRLLALFVTYFCCVEQWNDGIH